MSYRKSVYEYEAELARVVDGDTIDLAWVDLGFGVKVMPSSDRKLRFRILHVDTPEIRTRDLEEKAAGYAAKDFVTELLTAQGPVLVVYTEKPPDTDNFGRWLVDVKIQNDEAGNPLSDPLLLSELLITKGHAAPYED